MNEQPKNGDSASSFLKTDGGKTESNSIETPSITLPKGGGAISGIGEKFAANPVTGTGSMSVPIATSPGRAGFGCLVKRLGIIKYGWVRSGLLQIQEKLKKKYFNVAWKDLRPFFYSADQYLSTMRSYKTSRFKAENSSN